MTSGTAQSQIVTARDESGSVFEARVRLCWRWDDSRSGKKKYSAAQLRARLIKDDWATTLQSIVARDTSESVTHALLFKRSGNQVIYAALIPIDQLTAIWERQRDVSNELIAAGKMGKVRKNHAMNGESPTLWLMDQRTEAAHAVADVLWQWPGVVDLAMLPLRDTAQVVDDTYDDLRGGEDEFGSDGAERLSVQRSFVKRDARVRKKVLKRAAGGCERASCTERRDYVGFFDVHHILGVETSDRYWNCVALCPNCHRAAHYSPDREVINAELLKYAGRFIQLRGDEVGS